MPVEEVRLAEAEMKSLYNIGNEFKVKSDKEAAKIRKVAAEALKPVEDQAFEALARDYDIVYKGEPFRLENIKIRAKDQKKVPLFTRLLEFCHIFSKPRVAQNENLNDIFENVQRGIADLESKIPTSKEVKKLDRENLASLKALKKILLAKLVGVRPEMASPRLPSEEGEVAEEELEPAPRPPSEEGRVEEEELEEAPSPPSEEGQELLLPQTPAPRPPEAAQAGVVGAPPPPPPPPPPGATARRARVGEAPSPHPSEEEARADKGTRATVPVPKFSKQEIEAGGSRLKKRGVPEAGKSTLKGMGATLSGALTSALTKRRGVIAPGEGEKGEGAEEEDMWEEEPSASPAEPSEKSAAGAETKEAAKEQPRALPKTPQRAAAPVPGESPKPGPGVTPAEAEAKQRAEVEEKARADREKQEKLEREITERESKVKEERKAAEAAAKAKAEKAAQEKAEEVATSVESAVAVAQAKLTSAKNFLETISSLSESLNIAAMKESLEKVRTARNEANALVQQAKTLIRGAALSILPEKVKTFTAQTDEIASELGKVVTDAEKAVVLAEKGQKAKEAAEALKKEQVEAEKRRVEEAKLKAEAEARARAEAEKRQVEEAAKKRAEEAKIKEEQEEARVKAEKEAQARAAADVVQNTKRIVAQANEQLATVTEFLTAMNLPSAERDIGKMKGQVEGIKIAIRKAEEFATKAEELSGRSELGDRVGEAKGFASQVKALVSQMKGILAQANEAVQTETKRLEEVAAKARTEEEAKNKAEKEMQETAEEKRKIEAKRAAIMLEAKQQRAKTFLSFLDIQLSHANASLESMKSRGEKAPIAEMDQDLRSIIKADEDAEKLANDAEESLGIGVKDPQIEEYIEKIRASSKRVHDIVVEAKEFHQTAIVAAKVAEEQREREAKVREEQKAKEKAEAEGAEKKEAEKRRVEEEAIKAEEVKRREKELRAKQEDAAIADKQATFNVYAATDALNNMRSLYEKNGPISDMEALLNEIKLVDLSIGKIEGRAKELLAGVGGQDEALKEKVDGVVRLRAEVRNILETAEEIIKKRTLGEGAEAAAPVVAEKAGRRRKEEEAKSEKRREPIPHPPSERGLTEETIRQIETKGVLEEYKEGVGRDVRKRLLAYINDEKFDFINGPYVVLAKFNEPKKVGFGTRDYLDAVIQDTKDPLRLLFIIDVLKSKNARNFDQTGLEAKLAKRFAEGLNTDEGVKVIEYLHAFQTDERVGAFYKGVIDELPSAIESVIDKVIVKGDEETFISNLQILTHKKIVDRERVAKKLAEKLSSMPNLENILNLIFDLTAKKKSRFYMDLLTAMKQKISDPTLAEKVEKKIAELKS